MRLIFGRKPSALEKLKSATWHCASCGDPHVGMFDLASSAPDFWPGPKVHEPNGAVRMEGDFLSEDFCVLGGEDFFVRGVLEIPVHGLDQSFGFGIWSTLSRSNFTLYVERFWEDDYEGLGPWTGWFSNELRGYPGTLNQPCWVETPLPGQRPLIVLANDDHPLAVAQRDGITAERVLEIYEAHGHAPR